MQQCGGLRYVGMVSWKYAKALAEARILDGEQPSNGYTILLFLRVATGEIYDMKFINGATEKKLVRLEGFASIGRIAISLIHELNNPLDIIRRYVRSLHDQMAKDDPNREYVEQIQNGLMRISDVIGGLIDFTRANTSKFGPTDIRQSIEQSLSFYRQQISAQNIIVETEFDENIPTIMNADIGCVFRNIVENAIQAMPNGGTLSIAAEMCSPQLLRARFSDTGPGIPDELKESIFDPFFTTREPGQGIGLGLFISREIVESYSGTLEARSVLGIGTTFAVNLPMYRGKILVMDDEKHIRDLTARMLNNIGYKVITTMDGSDAIELYKEAKDSGRSYDAVILDLTVPDGMGGEEAIQRLLEIDPEVRAISSSGYINDPVVANFRDYGFRNTIHKPYSLEALDTLLHAVITSTDT